MKKERRKMRVGQVVTDGDLPNSPVYRILEILGDGRDVDTFIIRRIYGNQASMPEKCTMSRYRLATEEQCRNAGLVFLAPKAR